MGSGWVTIQPLLIERHSKIRKIVANTLDELIRLSQLLETGSDLINDTKIDLRNGRDFKRVVIKSL